MKLDISRRRFVTAAPVGAAATALFGLGWRGDASFASSPDPDREPHSGFPRQEASVVQSVVGASHFDLDRVKELVKARPALAKASWDWGFGDWESALGAASHVGRRDIAEVLIAHGARPNLFTLAMFGQVDAVRAVVRAVPGIQRIPGPHGITLLQHARARLLRSDTSEEDRDGIAKTVEYLESLGDADAAATSLELSDADRKVYVGAYRFGSGPEDVMTVLTNKRGELAIRRADWPSRGLNRVEPHAFAPVGAPEVRIRFDVSDGRATLLTVHDPTPLVKAVRVES